MATAVTTVHRPRAGIQPIRPARLDSVPQLFRVLASDLRYRLLCLLVEGQLSVTEIARLIDRPMGHVSHGLGTLYSHGLVAIQRIGRERIYELSDIVRVVHERRQSMLLIPIGSGQVVHVPLMESGVRSDLQIPPHRQGTSCLALSDKALLLRDDRGGIA